MTPSLASSPQEAGPYTGRFSAAHRPTLNSKKKRQVIERDQRCLNCGGHDRLTVDHKIPVSQGGTNAMSNLETLCYLCNQRKARREANRGPSGVVDFARCHVVDEVLEVIARCPPTAPVGARFTLYGTDGTVKLAEYEGYLRTGRMPARLLFKIVSTTSQLHPPDAHDRAEKRHEAAPAGNAAADLLVASGTG